MEILCLIIAPFCKSKIIPRKKINHIKGKIVFLWFRNISRRKFPVLSNLEAWDSRTEMRTRIYIYFHKSICTVFKMSVAHAHSSLLLNKPVEWVRASGAHVPGEAQDSDARPSARGAQLSPIDNLEAAPDQTLSSDPPAGRPSWGPMVLGCYQRPAVSLCGTLGGSTSFLEAWRPGLEAWKAQAGQPVLCVSSQFSPPSLCQSPSVSPASLRTAARALWKYKSGSCHCLTLCLQGLHVPLPPVHSEVAF